mgnify:FL=1
MKKTLLTLMAFVLSFGVCFANPKANPDEGMWLPMFFKQLNHSTMQKMGLKLSAEELYSINNSSLKDAIVQMGDFCTGEIVSDKGLMFTNHHCGYDAIVSQSTVEHDYLNNGFVSQSYEEELPIPGLYVSFLVRMEDVTKEVLAENINTPEKATEEQIQKNITSLIEKYSEEGKYKVEVKPFFEGLEYYMFIYEVFNDVRLVFAPPASIGKYGGDTDNWMWPRHTGDFSVFRVYADKNNQPAEYSKDNVPYKPKHFLPISIKGVEKGDFTMIWGYPGSTERYMTSYEVSNTINISDPAVIKAGEALLPVMKKMMDTDNAINLKYASDYASYMNLWKNKKGELRGLKRLDVYGKKKAIEDRLVEWIAKDADRQARYGNVIADLESASKVIAAEPVNQYSWYGNLGLMTSKTSLTALRSFMFASMIEGGVVPAENVEAFKGAAIAQIEELFATTDLETEKEMFKALANLLLTVPGVQADGLLQKYKENPDAFVDKAFAKSILTNKKAFEKFAKKPNMKVFAKDKIAHIAMLAYSLITEAPDELVVAEEKFAQAKMLFVEALRKMDASLVQYPDANFTMRMTYGQVLDYYPADAVHYDYVTTMEGLMEKEDATNPEFIVPAKLKELYEAKDYGQYADKDGKLIVCFLSNNDITGGNSGSPILNAEGHLIGLAFDGNWEAMSGDIAFEPELQRTINVDARYVLFVMDKFAGAKRLIDELTIVK